MAVAATLLTVSATSALAAQSDAPRASAAELAIDAAIPRPEPANVPPPTASDFKTDSTASVPDAAEVTEKRKAPDTAVKAVETSETRSSETKPSENQASETKSSDTKASETKPAEIVTAPAAEPKANDAAKNDAATLAPAAPAPATATAPAAEPAKEPVKA